MTTVIKGKNLITDAEFVTCPYCGDKSEQWRYLHWKHLKLSHGKKLDDVRLEFPNHPTMTVSFDQDRLKGAHKSGQTHNLKKKLNCIHCEKELWVKNNEGNKQACQECIDRGLENPDGRTKPEAQKKREGTFMREHGVVNPQQVEEFKQKTSNTFKREHGGRGFGSNKLAKKSRDKIKEKYGAENIMQTEEGLERLVKGLHQKYGKDITNPMQILEVARKASQTKKEFYLTNDHHLKGKTYIELFGEEKAKELVRLRRISGGEGFKKSLEMGYNDSKPQRELFKKVKEIFPEAKYEVEFLNPKFGFYYHLDMAIPEIKLCIEYDCEWTHPNPRKDAFRDKVLEKFGWKTIRFRNKVPTIDKIMDEINKVI